MARGSGRITQQDDHLTACQKRKQKNWAMYWSGSQGYLLETSTSCDSSSRPGKESSRPVSPETQLLANPMVCVLVGLGCRNNRTRRRLIERGLFSHSPEGWKPEIRMPAWLSPWEGPHSGSQVVLILPHAHIEERETELCYLFLKGN